MDEAIKLANTLAEKNHLTEDEFKLYTILLPYLEMQFRLLKLTCEKQAAEAGFNENDLRGFTP